MATSKPVPELGVFISENTHTHTQLFNFFIF